MNLGRKYNIVLRPHVSEKTARVNADSNQYVFEVASSADKAEIREAVESLFDVKVQSVQVVNVPGKSKQFRFRRGRQASWKKAYVRLEDGHSIELMGAEQA
ncbi:MAG: 50S ribosomal protein L23 [Xanthomonadales bacterium]|jgi:large subunit ribosomal protein L23|nr:50S ribosomal protein L23 [Xanthomonadales bacterium]